MMTAGDIIIPGTIASAASFIGMIFTYITGRSVRDLPLSTIRAAAQGPVALSGIAKPGKEGTIKARLTDKACLYYHLRITKESIDNDTTEIEDFNSTQSFLLDDETGQCTVSPKNANFFRQGMNITTWRGSKPDTQAPEDGHSSWGNYLFTETSLVSGTPLYVQGDFMDNTVAKPKGKHNNGAFIISTVSRKKLIKKELGTSIMLFTIGLAAALISVGTYLVCHGNLSFVLAH